MKITFRSDRDSDFANLEQYLKEGSFGDLPDAWHHQAEQDLDRLRIVMETLSRDQPWVSDEMRLQLMEFNEIDLPTRYDSPTQFRILEKLASRIKAAAKLIGIDTETFPHYSCIPTGIVNASAIALPNITRPFLLFDSQLFLYCHLFAKTFAQCLPVAGQGEMISLSLDIALVEKRISSTPELIERFTDLLSAYAVTGAPSQSKQYNPEAKYVHLLSILRDGMELFVVAHEFGHVYSGHLSGVLTRMGIHTEEIAGGNSSHLQEHEADLIGMLLTLHAMNTSGYDAALSYVGIELFFVSLDMAARTRHIVLNGEDKDYVDVSSETHPSNKERRTVLREFLGAFIAEQDQVEATKKMADAYTEIAEFLWKCARKSNPLFQRTVLTATE